MSSLLYSVGCADLWGLHSKHGGCVTREAVQLYKLIVWSLNPYRDILLPVLKTRLFCWAYEIPSENRGY